MQSFITAFATDDGNTFTSKHFGDAEKYSICRISEANADLLKDLINSSEEDDEKIHADPRKAGSIAKLLKQDNVEVVVSKVFGPNIIRIKKKFVCILSQHANIDDAISSLQNHLPEIEAEWEKGENRNYLKL